MIGYRIALFVAVLWSLSFAVTTEGGSFIDPSGGSAAATTNRGDHRCTIDPNGGPCTTGLTLGDSSSQLDPNG